MSEFLIGAACFIVWLVGAAALYGILTIDDDYNIVINILVVITSAASWVGVLVALLMVVIVVVARVGIVALCVVAGLARRIAVAAITIAMS